MIYDDDELQRIMPNLDDLPDVYGLQPTVERPVEYPDFDPLMESLKTNMYQAVGINPDVYREAQKRALEIGVTPFALMDFPELDKPTLTDYYIEELARETPALARSLAKDIDLAIASMDDIDDMRSYAMELAVIANSHVLPVSAQRALSPRSRFMGGGEENRVSSYAWHKFWLGAHGTMASIEGGKVLEDEVGLPVSAPNIAYSVVSPLLSGITGGVVGETTQEDRIKYHTQKAQKHAEALWGFNPNFFERLVGDPFGYLGTRLAWTSESANWATWGAVIGAALGAAFLVGPVAGFIPIGAGVLSGVTGGVSVTAGAGMGAYLGTKIGYGLGRINAFRLGAFYHNVLEATKKRDIHGKPLPVEDVLPHAYAASIPQAALIAAREMLVLNAYPRIRFSPLSWMSQDALFSLSGREFARMAAGELILQQGIELGVGIAGIWTSQVAHGGIWEAWHRVLRNRSSQPFVENTFMEDMWSGPIKDANESMYAYILPMVLGEVGKTYQIIKGMEQAERAFNYFKYINDNWKNGAEPKGVQRVLGPGAIDADVTPTPTPTPPPVAPVAPIVPASSAPAESTPMFAIEPTPSIVKPAITSSRGSVPLRPKALLPATADSLTQETTNHSGIGPKVYLSREALRTYCQNNDIDPIEAARRLGVEDQFMEDLPPKGDTEVREVDFVDLEIDTGVFANVVARSDAFSELGKKISTEPGELTMEEVDNIEVDLRTAIDQMVEESRTWHEERLEALEEARQIFTEVDNRAKELGIGLDETSEEKAQRINDQALLLVLTSEALTRHILAEDITTLDVLRNVSITVSPEMGIEEIKKWARYRPVPKKQDGYDKDMNILARGAITYDNATGKAVITLFKGHDATTVIHEFLGHYYLESLLRAEVRGELRQSGQDDLDTLREWVGVEPGGEFATEQKEKIASAVESYFLEGRAPSADLVDVFTRLKKTFLKVYETVRLTQVELTPEVRAVFDSMLTTEYDLEDLKEMEAYNSFMKNSEAMGITSEEAELVLTKMLEAVKDETASVSEKIIKPILTKIKRLADRRAELEKDAKDVLSKLPVYKARSIIFSIKEPSRVWRDEIIELFGTEALSIFRGGYVNDQEKSVPLATVAELAGYGGDIDGITAMHNDLASHPKLPDAVKKVVDDQIDGEIQSGLYGEGYRAMLEEARHSDNALMTLCLESLLTSGKKVNIMKEATMRIKNLKGFARQSLLKRPMNKISIKKYLALERKHAAAYDKALFDGKLELAVRHKDMQMMNHAFALEAMNLQAEIRKAMKVIDKFRKRGRKTFGYPSEIIKEIDAIVGDLNMSRVSAGEREIIEAIEQEVVETGEEMPPETARTLFRRDVATMEVGEVISIAQQLKDLAAEGKNAKNLIAAEEAQSRDEAAAAMTAHSKKAHPKINRARDKVNLNLLEKTVKGVQWYFNGHINFSYFTKILDNASDGPWRQKLYMPIERAVNKLQELDNKSTVVFNDLLKAHGIKPKELMQVRSRVEILGKRQALTLGNLLSIALYYGSSEGRQRLMAGYGLDDADMASMLSDLKSSELDFVGSVWKWLDTYFEPANEIFMKVFGEQMTRIAPLPYKVGERIMRGGYFPIYYDRELSSTPAQSKSSETYKKDHGVASMASNYTWDRVERMPTGAVVSLDFIKLLGRHLSDIHKDLALSLPMRDARGLINDQMVRDEMTRVLGSDAASMILAGLEYIEYGGDPPITAIDHVIRYARFGTTVVGLAFRWSPVIAQALGVFAAATEIGAPAAAAAILNFYSQPGKWKERMDFVYESSIYMKNRNNVIDKNLADMARKLVKSGSLDKVREAGFFLIRFADAAVTVPLWLHVYRDCKNKGMDHDAAVEKANQLIQETNNASRPIDLAQFQRGSGIHSLLTLFMSFMANLFRMARYNYGKAINDRDIGRAVAFTLWGIIMPAIALALIKGKTPKEDEYGEVTLFDWAKWVGGTSTLYYLGSFVGVRDIISPLSGYGYTLTPVGTGLGNLATFINNTYKAMTKEGYIEEKWPALGKSAVKALEFGLATPLYEPYRQLKEIYDVMTDEKDFEPRKLLFNIPYR